MNAPICIYITRDRYDHSNIVYSVSYLLHDVDLLWTQVSVYRRDAFHAVLTDDACCKRVGNDARRRLEMDKTQGFV